MVEVFDSSLQRSQASLASYAEAGQGLLASLNSSLVSCKNSTACVAGELAAALAPRGGLVALDAMVEHNRPLVTQAEITYSFASPLLESSVTKGGTIAAGSEVLVFGRMELPGEMEWWKAPEDTRGPDQVLWDSLRSGFSRDLGPMSLEDFRDCRATDLENFMSKVPLHQASAVRELYASVPAQASNATLVSEADKSEGPEPNFPPASVVVHVSGHTQGGTKFNYSHELTTSTTGTVGKCSALFWLLMCVCVGSWGGVVCASA